MTPEQKMARRHENSDTETVAIRVISQVFTARV